MKKMNHRTKKENKWLIKSSNDLHTTLKKDLHIENLYELCVKALIIYLLYAPHVV